jgi:hypothetical protein
MNVSKAFIIDKESCGGINICRNTVTATENTTGSRTTTATTTTTFTISNNNSNNNNVTVPAALLSASNSARCGTSSC